MRLCWLAVGLGLGIHVGVVIAGWPRACWFLGLGLGLFVLSLGYRRLWAFAAPVLCLAGGVGLGARAARPVAFAPGFAALLDTGRAVVIEATWTRSLRPAAQGIGARGACVLHRAGGIPVKLEVALTLDPGLPAPQAGDRFRGQARLERPRGLMNFGIAEPNLTPGLWARMAGAPVIEARGVALGPRRLAEGARGALARVIEREVPAARAPLLKALLLGERAAVAADVEAGFRAAGAVHALSVSGLHLSAIAALLFLVLRAVLLRIPALALRVRSSVVAAAFAIPAVLFYCLVTGEATATRRAALMAALGLGAICLRRPPSLPAALGGSALVLLLEAPLLLHDASFQLSFSSVVALALVGGRWREQRPAMGWARLGSFVARGLQISCAAFVVTAPLVAHHFGELALASPLGNLVLVPPVELGIVPVGLFGAALGALWAPLGVAPLFVADLLCRITVSLAAAFRVVTPVTTVVSPQGYEAAALLAAGLFLVTAAGAGWARGWLRLALVAALLGGGHLAWRVAARHLDRDVTVTFLDVGQGDAALIEGPRGFVALVDGGGEVNRAFDPGARVVEPVLRRKAITRIDLVVLSHAHPDHMNGLLRILERFAVDTLWSTGDRCALRRGASGYDALVALAQARGVKLKRPRALVRDGLHLVPLGPFVGDQIAAPEGLSCNDASLVLQLEFAGRRVLFTGDIEEEGEAELVARFPGRRLASDVLKVPHHGSRTSSGVDLLAAVAPALAVASCGHRNRFGFPRPEVVARYQAAAVDLVRTDRHGALAVRLGRDGSLQATCARSCR